MLRVSNSPCDNYSATCSETRIGIVRLILLKMSSSSSTKKSRDAKRKRKEELLEEKNELAKRVTRGLDDLENELKKLQNTYQSFIENGSDLDSRLASWKKFFKEEDEDGAKLSSAS